MVSAMPPNKPDVISCGAVVYRKDAAEPSYLLLQYGAKHWDFPKGHMEEGETEEETTIREIEEETAITDLLFIPGFRKSIRYSYRSRERLVRKQVVFRIARTEVEPEDVVLSHEHIGFEWLTYKKALSRLTFRNAKRILQEAHHHLLKEGVP